MRALATLLFLLQLGPLAGPMLCHAQMTCGMPPHGMAMAEPGSTRLEPAFQQHRLVPAAATALVSGLRAAPPAPPLRA